jgi:hypothetical protein
MKENEPKPNQLDEEIIAFREAFARIAERLTPEIEPAFIYRLDDHS